MAWMSEHVPELPGSGIIYALTVRVTKNEILAALNQPEQFILAIALVPPAESSDALQLHYVQRPFTREPGFGEVSVNYDARA